MVLLMADKMSMWADTNDNWLWQLIAYSMHYKAQILWIELMIDKRIIAPLNGTTLTGTMAVGPTEFVGINV